MKSTGVCRQRHALDMAESQSEFTNWKEKSETDTSQAEAPQRTVLSVFLNYLLKRLLTMFDRVSLSVYLAG
jgi:hypothetical protein